MKKVLVITHVFSTFVQRDITILEKKYKIKCHAYSGGKDLLSNLFAQIKLKIWLLWHIWTAHAVYIWFADYHAFLPVLFARIWKKRSFIVEGGYDTVSLPELKYGSHVSPLRSKMSTYAMKHASLNLPVSETLSAEILERIPKARVEHLYTGFDKNFFKSEVPKEKMVLTVAGKISSQRFKLKGVDVFVKAAEAFPDIPFVVVGSGDAVEEYSKIFPKNVKVTGRLSQEELVSYYQRAMIYAQFSIREGLPTSVCEAMLCECVPVGFEAGGIPVAIGKGGLVIKEKTPEGAVKGIQEAFENYNELAPLARKHVMDKFPEQLRESRLIEIIETN